jgi:predicted dehydrogenase
MSKRIRVAVLGAGIGRDHISAYAQLNDLFEVVYVCDLNADKANAGASLAPGSRAINDAQQIFADATVDLVDICLPPHLHASMSVEALRSGKHVVCEKPIAGSLDDASLVAQAAASAKKSVFPVFQYRYGAGYRAAHALKQQGMLGKPYVLALETHWQRDAAYYAERWRGSWKGELGGAIVSHAIHAHNLVSLLVGDITHVSAFIDTRVNPIETEDCAAISMRTSQGALVSSSITLGAAGSKSRFRACFEHVTMTSSTEPYHVGAGPWIFEATNPDRQAEFDAFLATVPPVGSRFVGQMTDIHAHLTGQTELYLPTFEEGRQSIELITALYDSAQNGRMVQLPLAADHPMRAGWQHGGANA